MEVYCWGISVVFAAIIESRANRMQEITNMVATRIQMVWWKWWYYRNHFGTCWTVQPRSKAPGRKRSVPVNFRVISWQQCSVFGSRYPLPLISCQFLCQIWIFGYARRFHCVSRLSFRLSTKLSESELWPCRFWYGSCLRFRHCSMAAVSRWFSILFSVHL